MQAGRRPNYNTIAQKSDLFVSVRPGTDGALALGMINYMEENGMTADSYMQKRSCAPFLVKTSDGMFLRKSDLDASIAKGSADDDYAVWDEATGTLGYASTASSPALRMKDLTVEGQQVSTSYSLLLDAAAQYPMDRTAEIVTVSEDVIKEFCNLLVNNGEAEIFQGYGVDHYGQGFQNLAAIDALRIVAGLVKDRRSPIRSTTAVLPAPKPNMPPPAPAWGPSCSTTSSTRVPTSCRAAPWKMAARPSRCPALPWTFP